MLTIEELTNSLPANLKKSASQELLDNINQITSDPMLAENIRNNFLTYTGVLKDGKFKTEDYLAAVMFVSFKLMNDSNKDAWCKTFPQRHAALTARGADSKEISAHVAGYAKGQLVNKILEQAMVPTWVLNQDLFQKALNTQAELMAKATSEKVRSDAANSILTHLKRPDVVKGQVDINIQDSSGMKELKDLLGDLARQQRSSMEGGTPIRQITDAVIINNDTGSVDGSD